MRRFAWLSSSVLAGVLLVACASELHPSIRWRADAEVGDRVVAVVNGEAIFFSALHRRAGPFLHRAMSAPSQAAHTAEIEAIYTNLLERTVEEELFVQAADRMQVSVTRAEVDRAIGIEQRGAGLPDAELWAAVEGRGYTPEQYRDELRRHLLRFEGVNHSARYRVSEEQIRRRSIVLRSNTDRSAVAIPAAKRSLRT